MRDQDGTIRHGMKRKALLLASALAGGTLAMTVAASPAMAQGDTAAQEYSFDIPAGPLSSALAGWAQVVGYQYAWSDPSAQSQMSPGVKGRMTAEEALRALTAGSGVSYSMTGPRTVMLSAGRRGSAGGAEGELVTGVVSVEGFQGSPYFGGAGVAAGVNGVNGSRDITATEGTGSFTSGALTIGSKVPQAMKDVPQSISVLTSERMEQQNVTDFTTAMKQLPGITLVQGDTGLESNFYSRGFAITSIQIDGGAPFSTQYNYLPQIDMAQYDHVELLRGAAGLFNGYGDPSGTVNLVRKKPLDHAQFSVEAQAGSWQSYRIVVDATSPLALDGKLRGRLVMAYQDNHYFYDTAKDNKTLIYGIAELDATPTTLVTAGISYARQDSVPWQYGLPRYQNGEDLGLPRTTSFAFPWNRWDFDTTEFFGGIEQKFGEDWALRLNLTHNEQASAQKMGFSYGAVNPTNGLGPQLNGSYYDYSSKQLSAEAVLTGAFELFGQRQEVTFGVNRLTSNGEGGTSYTNLVNTFRNPYRPYPGGPVFCQDFGAGVCPPDSIAAKPPIDVFDFDPANPLYTEPANPLASTRLTDYGQTQSGAYLNLRLTAFDRLHLTTGVRWSRYEYDYAYDNLCTSIPMVDPGGSSCFGKQIGDAYSSYGATYEDEDFSWPPAVNLSFDVNSQITAYIGYTDIYQSQANYLAGDHSTLPAVTGSNWETGVKWAAKDGKLNISLSAYRIRKEGFGMFDPNYPFEQVAPETYCCFLVNSDRTQQSEGLDIEVTGEILPGWQASASYTYSDNKQIGSYFGSDEGIPFVSIQPKHLYKIWVSYDFGAAGHKSLSGLTLSGGINGQSSAYYAGTVCVNFTGLPDPLTGAQNCASYAEPDYVPFAFTVPAYALLSARIDYRISEIWSLAVNVENIFDKTYYQTSGSDPSGGNWYGAPRSFTATLRAKW